MSNWFTQASTAQGPSSDGQRLQSTGGTFGNQLVQSPSSSLLFGAQQQQPPLQSPLGGYFGSQQGSSGGAGGLSQSQLDALRPLQQTYRPNVAGISASHSEDPKRAGQSPKQPPNRLSSGLDTGSPSTGGGNTTYNNNEPTRFGTNSLYGSGGISPSRARSTPQRQFFQSSANQQGQPMMQSPKLSRSRSSLSGLAYGSASPGGVGNASFEAMEEDKPPTRTYLDDGAAAGFGESSDRKEPSSSSAHENVDLFNRFAHRNTTASRKLIVFGLPYAQLDALKSYLARFGTVTDFQTGPPDSNYVIIEYADQGVAARVFRKSGELRWGNAILGVKAYDEDEESMATTSAPSGDATPGDGQLQAIGNQQQSQSGSSSQQPVALRSNTGLDSMINNLKPATATTGSPFLNKQQRSANPGTPQKQAVIQPEYMFGDQTGSTTPGGSSAWFGLPTKVSDRLFGR